jgi:murein DD-endopeptidase MepM/ murein hydrolase activator NlpD
MRPRIRFRRPVGPRLIGLGLVALLAVSVAGSAPAAARPRSASVPTPVATTDTGHYLLPVAGSPAVLRPFEPPPTPYAAGHRGVDLATTPNQVVGAAAAGLVSFAGPVAGRGVVVITHPDGVRTEYEPVDPAVRRGQAVNAGEPIGTVDGQHDGCQPSTCLHWGARRGDEYFDPMTLLTPLGPVHLIPWTGRTE